MTDYLLRLSELYWSITLYWSSFSSLSVYGGFQKTGNRDGHGAGNNVCDDAGVYLRLAYRYVDLIPLNLIYLRTLAFILVIAVVVQFTEMVVRKTSPVL
ncbi:electron transport complex protein RnfA [Escherichia coli]|nr:electron transport complex protein RnfA [Escherichia coli]